MEYTYLIYFSMPGGFVQINNYALGNNHFLDSTIQFHGGTYLQYIYMSIP